MFATVVNLRGKNMIVKTESNFILRRYLRSSASGDSYVVINKTISDLNIKTDIVVYKNKLF